MKNISKIFNGIRKGLEFLDKASKLLQSIEIVSNNLKSMVNDLEKIWTKKDETQKVAENEAV